MVLRRMVHHIREEDVKDITVPSSLVQTGLTPAPKQRWEASQSLAQFASAQRCQAGPLLHEQVGKEEVCDGQLAYEQIQHLI